MAAVTMVMPNPGADAALPPIGKVAAFLLALGREAAQPLLKRLDDEELKLVARASAGLGPVPAGAIADLLADFERRIAAESEVRGTPEMVESLLEGAVAPERLSSIRADLRGEADTSAWVAAAALPPERLAALLVEEQPQVAAQILFRLGAGVAAKALEAMADEPRNLILRRMLGIRPATDAVLRRLATGLAATLAASGADDGGGKGKSVVAGIINNLDRRQADLAMQEIEAAAPAAAEALKALLFSFDDLAKLSARARAAVMETVPSDRLVAALAGSTQEFRDVVLSSLAARARRIVESELAGAPEMSPKDVSQARRDIARQALKLAGQGKIDLAPEPAAA